MDLFQWLASLKKIIRNVFEYIFPKFQLLTLKLYEILGFGVRLFEMDNLLCFPIRINEI